jgi:hypothetical protein
MCDDSSPSEDEDEDEYRGVDLADMSVLRYRADEDAIVLAVEGWVVSVPWDADADARFSLEVADTKSCALRSTPSTILEPDG